MIRKTLTIPSEAGELRVHLDWMDGTERVLRGETVLSRKQTWGLPGEHRFRMPDEAGAPEYRLRIGTPWGWSLWRGDLLLARHERSGERHLVAFGLSFVGAIALKGVVSLALDLGSVLGFSSAGKAWGPRSLSVFLVSALATPLVSWALGRWLRGPGIGDVRSGSNAAPGDGGRGGAEPPGGLGSP